MSKVTPFPSANVPLVGQPVTLLSVLMLVTAMLQCNCGGGGAPIGIVNSTPAPCSACGKVYNVAFNPQNGQLQVSMAQPEGVAS